MSEDALDVLLLSDFNAELFAGYLQNGEGGPKLDVKDAGYAQALPVLASGTLPGTHAGVATLIVWTRPESVSRAFARLLDFEPVSLDEILAETQAYADAVARMAASVKTVLTTTWTLPPRRSFGLLEMDPVHGAQHVLSRMNILLSEVLTPRGVHVLSAERWMGGEAFSPKRWYMGKVPFANAVFREAAKDMKAALRGIRGEGRKLIVLDLDDTLWGGVVGDDGWENLVLGGHDPAGEALVDFQRRLKALSRRGILLAVVSKNTESVALEAIKSHPEMVLSLDDFAGWRINWDDKAKNIADLVDELNLGLQSVVFLDDNPVERARVRDQLPEVFVPEWPSDKTQYPHALSMLDCFEIVRVSDEDRQRASMYRTERQRRELRSTANSPDDWFASLETVVSVEPLAASNAKRVAQLLNKTNQLNLRTRRLTEAELSQWAAQPGHSTWAISVRDKFGSSGITGIVSVSRAGRDASIEDFVLSCRVMGRRVEETLLYIAGHHARASGMDRLVARYIASAKNAPCLEFFRRSGMRRDEDGSTFSWDLSTAYPRPAAVTLENLDP